MAKRKSASYMSPGEQIAGTVFFVIYLVVLPFVTAPLFRLAGRLLGVTISQGLQNVLYYYILFAVTLIIFHGFLARTSRRFADNLGTACQTVAVGLVALCFLVPGFIGALIALWRKTADTKGLDLDTVTGCEWD